MKKTKAKVKAKKKVVKKKKPKIVLMDFTDDYYNYERLHYCDCPDCLGHEL